MKKSNILILAALCGSLAACGGGGGEADQQAAGNGSAAQANGTAGAQSPSANAADSIKARQTHYKEIGRAMKGINDELKKPAPDVSVLQQHAATINRFAPQIEGWFPDGSGAEAGIKTGARAEIWSKPAEFRKAATDFVAAADTFHRTAQTGNIDAIRTGVRPLGASCKACHDQFRVED